MHAKFAGTSGLSQSRGAVASPSPRPPLLRGSGALAQPARPTPPACGPPGRPESLLNGYPARGETYRATGSLQASPENRFGISHPLLWGGCARTLPFPAYWGTPTDFGTEFVRGRCTAICSSVSALF